MKILLRQLTFYSFGFFLCICLTSSCTTTYKSVPYFTDLPQTGEEAIKLIPYKEPVIQTDDLLSITIQTIDPTSNALFQQNDVDATALSSLNPSVVPINPLNKSGGYLVDKNGNIELPFAGTTHIAGLTRMQARDTIYSKLHLYFKTLTVDVRFSNFKVTVIGEVLRPSAYILPNEKVTIFDALGMAGDLTVYGKRENVVLLRDSADEKKLIRLNLNSKDIVKSPYFFLKQNDVIYVEPSKAKAASLDAARTRNYTILASALSVLIVLATRIK